MNGKYPAKVCIVPAAAAVLAAWLIPLSATADFDDLDQQLRVQQQKSRFRLMLEQVQESARQRAATRTASGEGTGSSASAPVALGDWTKTGRLTPMTTTDLVPPEREAAAQRRLQAAQAYERDQRAILDQRQRRDALVRGPRTLGSAGDGYAAKRRNLVRYRTQSKRLSLQRKLRR